MRRRYPPCYDERWSTSTNGVLFQFQILVFAERNAQRHVSVVGQFDLRSSTTVLPSCLA